MNDLSFNIFFLIVFFWYMWKNIGNYDYLWELKCVFWESFDE